MIATTDVIVAGSEPMRGSTRPAALESFAGRPILWHVIRSAKQVAEKVHVICDEPRIQEVMADAHVDWHVGDARDQLERCLDQLGGTVLVLAGEIPLVDAPTLAAVAARVDDNLIVAGSATTEEPSILAADGALACRLAKSLRGGAILVAIVKAARRDGVTIDGVDSAGRDVAVRAKWQLATLERKYQKDRVKALVDEGLRLHDPARFDLRGELTFGTDVEIDVNVVVEGDVSLGDGVRVGAFCILRDVTIGAGTTVHSHTSIESATIGDHCYVGPYARVRPGTELGDDVQIGNFVETKAAVIASKGRINHLSYIGDAELEHAVTIGAGTITCNYDGKKRNRTLIRANAFIGSGTELVAPVEIGEGATIGSGSTITRDAPAGELTIARSRQVVVKGWTGPRSTKE